MGFHPVTAADLKRLTTWLTDDVLPFDTQARHGIELAFDWCATQRMEPPASAYLERIIRSTVHHYETQQFATIETRLTARHRASISRLIARDFPDTDEACDEIQTATTLSQLKTDPGKVNLDSLLTTFTKLKCINEIGLLAEIFQDIPLKFIDQYHQRCATEFIRELRRHPDVIRYNMVTMFCWRRRQQLIDALIDSLLQVSHNLEVRAEKRIDKSQLATFKKVRGKPHKR